MFGMTTKFEDYLSCMPFPCHVVLDGPPEQHRRLKPSTFRCVAMDDPQVMAYAEERLGAFELGVLELSITMPAQGSNPHASMDESYSLKINDDVIELRAASTWGGVRGIATLAQLARCNQLWRGLEIDDSPRFAWRGLLLDVARHFFPIQSLMRVVDGMAALKMNVLHLHLSDDQAFRFPSTAFPKLPSDQHYTADELRDLVRYAADRGVRVLPELDMPGHVTSWLVAYPEWGSEPISSSNRFGVHMACLNPNDEAVLQAVETLLRELTAIFPDEYIHLGGDEVSPVWWQRDPDIAAYMQSQCMSTPDLQNQFLQNVCGMVSDLGRKAVAWDEVVHERMPDCVVQNWRGATTRDQALALSKPVLISAPYYLDLNYSADLHYGFDPEASQELWLELEDALQLDPRLLHVAGGIEWTKQWRAGAVNRHGAPRVLGGEACLWTELVDPDVLPTRLWSRLPAVAERLWSPVSCTDVESMYRRLESSWLSLPEDPEVLARANLVGMGLGEAEVALLSLVEPVKWYGRLLGEQALQARLSGSEMPKARPYQADTPLNRVADFLLPESMAARRLAALSPFAAAHRVKQLQSGRADRSQDGDWQPCLSALSQGADVLLGLEQNKISLPQAQERLHALAIPYGEYIAAPLIHWRIELDNMEFDASGR